MAVLKCKMCGGDLNVTGGEKVVECEFCGTTQTVPDGNDEKKTNLFNRANKLRIVGEFDKAAGIYESITAEFPDDAESYWGLCLCKFGIEYVDDPKTARKIPTCHRTSFESIFDDENYKAAIDKSDVIAQDVYKNEAAEIDRLQKDILSVVHNENPFDVFICYKETDDLGARTPDSVLAQDIYTELTNQGLKVFFARITLEDKLGKEYEPYIFAALNSAKVMLAIGTKEEYFNSVWVKNEWSRYLALMQSDKSKTLIPCYRDMDAYDIPQEFKNLQGQDMSKLGFLQDLVRGVCKIINPEQSSGHENETSAQPLANSTVDTLLKRVFMFLEDENWKSANEYCERVLDINPECAEAYLAKMMVLYRRKKRTDLKTSPIEKTSYYKKIIAFGDAKLKKEIQNYVEKYNKAVEEHRIAKTYQQGIKFMEEDTDKSLKRAISLFESIIDYNDSKTKKELCLNKLDELEEKRIISILKQSDEPLRAIEIRGFKHNKISKPQSRLEKMAKNNIVEIINDDNLTRYCLNGYKNRKRIKEIDAEIQKLKFIRNEKIREEIEAAAIQDRIKSLSETKNALSIFAIKKKKQMQLEIEELLVVFSKLEKEIKLKHAKIDAKYNKQIDVLSEEKRKIKELKSW